MKTWSLDKYIAPVWQYKKEPIVLLTIMLSDLLWYTNSDCPFKIFKLFLLKSSGQRRVIYHTYKYIMTTIAISTTLFSLLQTN